MSTISSVPEPSVPSAARDLIEPAEVFPAGGQAQAFQLIDVRAPAEVSRSGIPGALSMPILNDEERAAVGTCYHERGQAAAVALGFELTAPHREARVAAWREAVASSDLPTAFACWRGGKRSGLATEWLGDANVPRVAGGTKALRRYLMAGLEAQFARTETLVISGLTGCGKTDLLHALRGVVPPDVLALDLEGLANHRGSAFGGFPEGQPAQQTFENALAATVHLAAPRMTLLEDEARFVGHVEVPAYIHARISESSLIILEATTQERSARIFREYIEEPTARFSRHEVRAELEGNIKKLAKRLSGVYVSECLAVLENADHEDRWLSLEAHSNWIEILLEHYYDKLYHRAVARMDRPVSFRGSAPEVIAWFAEQDRAGA